MLLLLSADSSHLIMFLYFLQITGFLLEICKEALNVKVILCIVCILDNLAYGKKNAHKCTINILKLSICKKENRQFVYDNH
jgi:hypothetical protein